MKRVSTWSALVVAIALCSTSPSASESTSRLSLSIEEGLLSYEAEAVPLRDLLEALAAEAGFALELRGEVSGPVSRRVLGQPIERALADLLGGAGGSYLLRYGRDAAAPSGRRITKLILLSGGDRERLPSVEPASRAPDESRPTEPEALDAATAAEAIELLEGFLDDETDDAVRLAAEEALVELESLEAGD